jgi:hypothetical protein
MMRLIRFFPTRWWSPRAWRTWRSYLHWRLETYGVFYPNGKLDKEALKSLIRQAPGYYRWLGQMDRLHKRSR